VIRYTTAVDFESYPGRDGKDNYNTANMRFPVKIPPVAKAECISSFRIFSQQSIINSIDQNRLKSFMEYLNISTQSLAGPAGLVDELKSLELLFYQANADNFDFCRAYESLHQRIIAFANETVLEDRDKKILNYLLIAVQTKIESLQHHFTRTLVLDAKTYLKSTKKNIQKLFDAKTYETIQAHRNDYKSLMDDKIREGKQLVNVNIAGEIKRMESEIGCSINALLEEVYDIETSVSAAKNSLLQKKKKLKVLLGVAAGIDVLKTFNSTLALFSIVGDGLSTAFETGINIAENLVLPAIEKVQTKHKQYELPDVIFHALTSKQGALKQILVEKLEVLGRVVSNHSNLKRKFGEVLGGMQDQIAQTSEDLIPYEDAVTSISAEVYESLMLNPLLIQ
jgi:hypothetical protein